MTAPPKDRYNAVWLIFFTLGLGTLLPWNFFMTATMYFTSRLGDPAISRMASDVDDGNDSLINDLNSTEARALAPERTQLQSKFNNVMTLCAMLPLLIFTCLNSILHSRIPQKIRIAGSLAAIFVVFLLTAVFVKIEFSPGTFFTVTMIKIVFINSFGALLQGSLFGLAALFPASYTAPIMSGQGLAGTFAAFAMICAIASGSELEDSAFGYFITACVVVLLALVSYLVLPKLEFYRYYTSENLNNTASNGTDMELKKDLLKGGPLTEAGGKAEHGKPSIINILKKIWVLALSVCLVFAVTIGIFPAVTADVKSTIAGDSSWGMYFIPVSCFLMFNMFDWAGRSITARFMWPGKDSKLLPIMVAARFIFWPLFMLCNVMPRHYLPTLLAHDAWYIGIMIVFALSNGYLASLCMCFGPKKVDGYEAETAGAIMAFFLSLGLALGAGFSFPLRILV
ncbi:equilibrative nucleoside transporter 1 [Rana temporaria]|uniref:equilibrative nucleoside transporter 1 n=1 Tax=Rana temporaria TaxID=8407 RepID=UPI001AADCD35|nr:equilibrative nucleoside transporter 1 [Rana temporaria]XP_040207726.1 equilibrative nucleoside transporter 1 [Rana temporaria]